MPAVRKSLSDLLMAEDLSGEEQKLLNQKLQNLDKVAARGIPKEPGRPIRGSRWYGEYRLFVDWDPDVNVLEFDGTNDVIDFGDVLDLTGDYSIEAWVWLDRLDQVSRFVSKQSGGTGWGFDYPSATLNQLRFFHYNMVFASTGTLTLGVNDAIKTAKEWHHIAAVIDVTNHDIQMYVDGELIKSDTFTGTPVVNAHKLSAMADVVESLYYTDGRMRDLRIWSKTLTQAEIQASMDIQLVGTETNLAGYWKLDEGSGTTATDSAGANNGTISGATWISAFNPIRPIYDGTYDDLTERFIAADIRRGLPQPLTFTAVPGQIEIELENRDRRFSSDYASSPLFSFINSNDKKRCKMEVSIGGTEHQLFEGWVQEIAAQPLEHGRKTATLVITDLVGIAAKTPASVALQQDVDEVTLIKKAMENISAPVRGVGSYGSAVDSYPYAGDTWRESQTAVLDAIRSVMRSSLGYWYVDRSGTSIYKNRQFRPLNATNADWDAHTLSVIDATGLTSEQLATEVILTLRQRTTGTAASVLWTLDDTPTILPGENRVYTALFTDPTTGQPCGVVDEITPVAGTDYTPNTTDLSITVDWRGADAFVTVKNVGSSALTLQTLQLRGTPVTRYQEVQVSAPPSSEEPTRQVVWHETELLQNVSVGKNLVEWLFTLFSDYTDAPRRATITPIDATSLAEVCQLDIDRKVNVIEGEVSFVNWVHHRIGRGYHVAVVGLTPSTSVDMWVLGVSQLGIDTALGV